MSRPSWLVLAVIAVGGVACAAAPKPTAESRKIRKNSPALVEGRVLDTSGHPVAGIAVRGIPWSKDLPWSAPATTACDGTFRLALAAPGSYGFLLLWRGTAVITPSAEDPSRVAIAVEPGRRHGGVELVFLRQDWQHAIPSAPPQTPACP